MNYGQPLRFGAFLTPSSAAPDNVTFRVQRCEELGYDLAVFQDHPYLPELADMWTLLSWVAGRTSRIQLAPGVANMALRDPAVLARSAANLDLLTEGRISLGVGAGAYRDQIEEMGGPTRRGTEAVQALSEAVDVMRGILDAGAPGPFRYDGLYHHIDGIERGPYPAHRIPLWLGGYRRHMLTLVGTKADGWMPSLFGDQPERELQTLRRGSELVDDAARLAGRDPAEIRRLLNVAGRFTDRNEGFLQGPVAQWVEDLVPLVVEDGFSTLILGSDDDETLARYIEEVAPALRDAVDERLAESLPLRDLRPRSVLAERRSGIDYDNVPESLADDAIEPGDIDYPRIRSTRMRGGAPGIVLRPRTVDDVVEAVGFARDHAHLPLGIRSGGHGISGRSTNDGGIVVDLCRLHTVTIVDEAARRVRVGPGAKWRDVAAAIEPQGWAISSGDFGGVGVGGLTVSGGIGLLNRDTGLTIDRLRSAEIVLADGQVVQADERHDADLFWAVRGAGANIGVVTSFEFEASRVSNVGWAQIVYSADDLGMLLQRFGAVASAAPRDATAFLVASAQPGQPAMAKLSVMVNSSVPNAVRQRLQPFLDIGDIRDAQAVIAPYASVIGAAPDFPSTAQGDPVVRSGFTDELNHDVTQGLSRLLQSRAAYMLQVRTIGGASADVDPAATAFAYRRDGFSLAAMGSNSQRMSKEWDVLRPRFDGLYTALESDDRPERLDDAYPPLTLQRLRKIKSQVDPHNLFRDNFNVKPSHDNSIL